MSRLQPIEKTCKQCNKLFFAKRSDASFCGNVCRARHSDIAKAKPAIVAEAKQEIIAEVQQVLEGENGIARAKILIKSLQEKFGASPDQPHYETEAYKQHIREIWKLD
jgi:hypothetical protein